jgi:predicted dehydrogenase
MGYMFRGNPAMQWCAKAVAKGWLGDVFEITAGMSHSYGGPEYQKYLANFKGGIMFNLGCHFIDLIVTMLGRPENVTSFLKSTHGAADNAKNNCLAVLEYPSTLVSLHACGLETDGVNHRRFKVCGTKGAVELSPLELFNGERLKMNLTLLDGNEEYSAGKHVVDFGIKRDRYETQFLEFAEIINGKIKNPYTFEHDYLTQEVVLMASGYKKIIN